MGSISPEKSASSMGRTANDVHSAFIHPCLDDAAVPRLECTRPSPAGAGHDLLRDQRRPRQGRRPRRPRRRRRLLPNAGGHSWRGRQDLARLPQHQRGAPGGPVNARDRIGSGPWKNFKGDVVATSVDDLHGANNKFSRETALTEKGTMVNGVGMQPNQHDAMTGSTADGRVFPVNLNLTCNNWSSSTFGSTMLGHIDRTPKTPANLESWDAAHMSRSCSQPDLIATGGNGLFYCFAQ